MRPLPRNEAAEKALIGIIAHCLDLAPEVDPDIFHHPIHKEIFLVLLDLSEKKAPVDLVDCTHILSRIESMGRMEEFGGQANVFNLVGISLGRASFGYYHALVSEAAAYRKFIVSCRNGMEEAYSMRKPLEELVASVQNESASHQLFEFPDIKEQAMAFLDELEQDTPPECFPTGLIPLDRMLRGGVRRKEFAVVAAATSRGKSLLLGQAAVENVTNNKKVAYFSLEMPAPAMLARLVSNYSGIEIIAKYERQGPVMGRTNDKICRSILQLSEMPITIVDSVCTLDGILNAARIIKRKKGLDCLIADYIQRIENGGDNREQAVATIARKLKNFAMEENVAVFSASQLNDDGQVRESRAIGHESDILIHIQDVKNDTQVSLPKFRRGKAGGMITVTRRGEIGRFDAQEEAVVIRDTKVQF